MMRNHTVKGEWPGSNFQIAQTDKFTSLTKEMNVNPLSQQTSSADPDENAKLCIHLRNHRGHVSIHIAA